MTLAGLALRIPSFSDSLNGDELATYFVTTGHGLGRVIDIVQSPQEVTPPLYPIVASLTQGIGDSLNSLRWVSLVAGVAAIPLTYLLGLRTIGRAPALVGAAVMALSPFMIFYATEARAYALMMVLCLGSTLALLHAVDTPRKRWWALYAVLSCAAMYTHYTAGFVLAGQAVWALVAFPQGWKWILGANVVAGLAYVPWLSSYQADQDSPGAAIIGVLQPFGLEAFKTDVLHWAISHPDISFSVRQMPGKLALALLSIGVVAALVATGVEVVRRRQLPTRPGRGLVLVFVLAAATPVLAGLYSSFGVSVFLPRNLIASSPGLALVLGVIVTQPRQRAVSIACSVLLLAGFAIGGVKLLNAQGQRADYKAVARYIAARGGPDAVTVDVPGLSPGPLSQLDAAAAPGKSLPRKPAILRLSRPSRAAQLLASRPGGPGQFANLPIPAPKDIARQAARQAGDSRTIFLVSPGKFKIEQRGAPGRKRIPDQLTRPTLGGLLATGTPISEFLAALPPGFRAVETRTFPGTFGLGKVTVYVLRRAPDAG